MARSRTRPAAGAPVLKRPVADLRALAHPLRLRMMELFAEQPRTTKQVAELLGEPPTRLYHHVAALERAGLLVLKETRQNRGVQEKWYVGVAKQYRGTDAKSLNRNTTRGARRALAAAVLDQAKQELLVVPKGSEPPLLARLVMRARPKDIPTIRRRLLEIVRELSEELSCGDEPEGESEVARWAITLALTPTPRPRKATRRAGGDTA